MSQCHGKCCCNILHHSNPVNPFSFLLLLVNLWCHRISMIKTICTCITWFWNQLRRQDSVLKAVKAWRLFCLVCHEETYCSGVQQPLGEAPFPPCKGVYCGKGSWCYLQSSWNSFQDLGVRWMCGSLGWLWQTGVRSHHLPLL